MSRATRAVGALAVCLALGTACGKSSPAGAGASATGPAPSPRPSSPARLTIVSPTNGQVLTGAPATVPVDVKLSGAQIVSVTSTHTTPTKGHLHVYLDNQIVTMNYSAKTTVGNVPAGMHILRVEFVASDHLPFDPRVIEQVTFEVKA